MYNCFKALTPCATDKITDTYIRILQSYEQLLFPSSCVLFKPGTVRLRIFYTEKAFLSRRVFRYLKNKKNKKLKEERLSELRMWVGVGVGVGVHVESHASVVSLLESGEQRHIKVIHNNISSRAQELCESRGGRPGLPSLISLRFLWT